MAFCVRGYCRIGSEAIAFRPSTRIIRLTTIASTGRRMKISVNDMRASAYWSTGRGLGSLAIAIELSMGDAKLKELIDAVNELLKTPWLEGSGPLADGLTQQLRELHGQSKRLLSPAQLGRRWSGSCCNAGPTRSERCSGRSASGACSRRGAAEGIPAYLPEALGRSCRWCSSYARGCWRRRIRSRICRDAPAALRSPGWVGSWGREGQIPLVAPGSPSRRSSTTNPVMFL